MALFTFTSPTSSGNFYFAPNSFSFNTPFPKPPIKIRKTKVSYNGPVVPFPALTSITPSINNHHQQTPTQLKTVPFDHTKTA